MLKQGYLDIIMEAQSCIHFTKGSGRRSFVMRKCTVVSMQILVISPHIQYCRPIELNIRKCKLMKKADYRILAIQTCNVLRVCTIGRYIAISILSKNWEVLQNTIRMDDGNAGYF